MCGKKFGTASICIHQKQCLKKRAMQQALLPPHLRTALLPPELEIPTVAGPELDYYNEVASRNCYGFLKIYFVAFL